MTLIPQNINKPDYISIVLLHILDCLLCIQINEGIFILAYIMFLCVKIFHGLNIPKRIDEFTRLLEVTATIRYV